MDYFVVALLLRTETIALVALLMRHMHTIPTPGFACTLHAIETFSC